jgi:hypothetical protein
VLRIALALGGTPSLTACVTYYDVYFPRAPLEQAPNPVVNHCLTSIGFVEEKYSWRTVDRLLGEGCSAKLFQLSTEWKVMFTPDDYSSGAAEAYSDALATCITVHDPKTIPRVRSRTHVKL